MSTDPRDEERSENPRYYDVDRFKQVVEAPMDAPTSTLTRLVGIAGRFVDSIMGVFVTFGTIAVVMAAPVIVIIGAIYGLVGFLVSFLGLIGLLGFYVERKLGASIQVSDYSMRVRLFAQMVGFCAIAGIFVFLALVLPRLGLHIP